MPRRVAADDAQPGQQVRERAAGLEPAFTGWRPVVLPLDDARRSVESCRGDSNSHRHRTGVALFL